MLELLYMIHDRQVAFQRHRCGCLVPHLHIPTE